MVVVPDVTDKTIAQASDLVFAAGLKVKWLGSDIGNPNSRIEGQSPDGGRSLAKGSIVTITLWNTPPP
jgi:beta-lactam-binding protein with PASTA domain